MKKAIELTAAPPSEADRGELAEGVREQARRFATLSRHVSEDELAEQFRQVATDLFAHALEIERDRVRRPSS